ncbi:MAG: GDP-mannose 4,6-dehydratase [Candidatus Altiarchaeota archaeon]|nr:GDP-mannose 4,6-dehydratase [Candidatus Altiarchaeota archaeon]
MSVMVTGGAGFIGSHLCERLLEKGEKVVCVDDLNDFYSPKIKKKNLEKSLENKDFRFYEEDILNKEAIEEIVRDEGIEEIVHLAARAGVRPSIKEPILYSKVNIEGTLNLLETARELGIEQFIFGSSSSVYGINSRVPYREDDKVDKPISPYAASKRAGELFCYNYSHLYGIPITCLRFFTVYGPRQRPEMAIHKFTRLIDSGKKIPMYGDGTSKRDYTYIDDIIDGVLSSLEKKFRFEVFNLGNSETVELKHMISLIEENLGKKAEIEQQPEQPGDVPITYADITKAEEMLDYKPKTSIEEGIRRFTEWRRRQSQ